MPGARGHGAVCRGGRDLVAVIAAIMRTAVNNTMNNKGKRPSYTPDQIAAPHMEPQ
jgi:hypothetical protein